MFFFKYKKQLAVPYLSTGGAKINLNKKLPTGASNQKQEMFYLKFESKI